MIKDLIGLARTDVGFAVPLIIGQKSQARTTHTSVSLSLSELAVQQQEPIPIKEIPGRWLYRDTVVTLDPPAVEISDEERLRIKHAVLRREKAFRRMKREVEAFERLEATTAARRERIPEAVRLFVWQRDEGKCVKCGSCERLEYDHVIPVADGGSSTERNVQLLCQACNRAKGRSV